MNFLMVDVESDGPIPGDYSMISFGAVLCEPSEYKKPGFRHKTFYGKLKPISNKWIPEALAVSGHTREETLTFADPELVMDDFAIWIKNLDTRVTFISDNNGFDWQFINWYFWHFTDQNPLGYSSQNLGSLYKGLVKNSFQNFKHLRKTKHSHNPIDDSMGNVEALYHMIEQMGYKVSK